MAVTAVLCQLHNVNDHCKRDCSHARLRHVCGSDHVNYASTCEFAVASCIHLEYHGRALHIKGFGTCRNTSHVLDHCNDLCNEEKAPLCASDGMIYDNKCRFLRSQCEAAKMGVKLFLVAK